MLDEKIADEHQTTVYQADESSHVPTSSQPVDSDASRGTGQVVDMNNDDNLESTYHLKWIPWNSGKIPIVMQSINGPCPLIATMNVLLLREKVKLPPMLEQITAAQLLTYLGECLTDSVPDDIRDDENALLNFEQNIHDAIEILPKLKTGLDVNIKFAGITDFEYTPECIIFDILRIPLYHGWISDPSLHELIGSQSYNQLVDNIITNKASTDPDMQAKVLIAEEFLEQTASQLTIYGLQELRSKIKDNEIGILFRNNHFLTLFKREGEIYTLVTDHGYLTEEDIIWETLDNIEGAGRFFDASFQLAEVSSTRKRATATMNDELEKQIVDYLMTLDLEKEGANNQVDQTSNVPEDRSEQEPGRSGTSVSEPYKRFQVSTWDDFELARRLQDEENRIYEEMMRQRRTDERTGSVTDSNIRSSRSNTNRANPIPNRSCSANAGLISSNSGTNLRPERNVFVPESKSASNEQVTHVNLRDTSYPSITSHGTTESACTQSARTMQELEDERPMAEECTNLPNNTTVRKIDDHIHANERNLENLTSQRLPSSQSNIQAISSHLSAESSHEQSDLFRDREAESGAPSTADDATIRITATSTTGNLSRQQIDRSRHKSEKNTKETTCIVH